MLAPRRIRPWRCTNCWRNLPVLEMTVRPLGLRRTLWAFASRATSSVGHPADLATSVCFVTFVAQQKVGNGKKHRKNYWNQAKAIFRKMQPPERTPVASNAMVTLDLHSALSLDF
ncbi:unnamed protein product [Durusdinium trenchii]|uniref:Uncharacterized protein n=1 Tax=Durusdinium trenchii TaxID=1381693 RepID=A0ABP0P839_9DINO